MFHREFFLVGLYGLFCMVELHCQGFGWHWEPGWSFCTKLISEQIEKSKHDYSIVKHNHVTLRCTVSSVTSLIHTCLSRCSRAPCMTERRESL